MTVLLVLAFCWVAAWLIDEATRSSRHIRIMQLTGALFIILNAVGFILAHVLRMNG